MPASRSLSLHCVNHPYLEPVVTPDKKKNYRQGILTGLYIVGALLLFLFALDLMTSSLRHMSGVAAETIIVATSNPFAGLFIGLLITAMVQSSSTTTAMAVALVAAGSITLESAVPIIMGANIGTTITSTIIALGFIDKKKEFRRALATATYHDFFNILTAFILFPLEYYYGFLSGMSTSISDYLFNPGSPGTGTRSYYLISAFGPPIDFLVRNISSGFVLAVLSFGLLFISVIVFRRLISNLLTRQSPERFSRLVFTNPAKSFFWGLITTAAIRSSTVTTSLVVPIAAKKVVSLRKVVPFILGANIGTTITAFIAALTHSHATAAVSIAVAHFLFNFIGFLVFYPVPALRKVPIWLANELGKLTLKYRLAGFVYILAIFFFIPFSLLYLNRSTMEILDARYERTDHKTMSKESYHIISRMNRTTRSGEWLTFQQDNMDPGLEPNAIVPVYIKNNILFIDNEMHMFNRPGFCWDGENTEGRYKACVEDVLPSVTVSGITFDSVYVYQHRFKDPSVSGISASRYYISVHYPLILKQEILDEEGNVVRSEQITKLESK